MFVCQKYSHLSLTLLAMAQSAFSVPQWDSEGLLAWASSSWSDIQKHRSQIRQIIVSSFSQQNQSKKKFFLRLRWYKPLLKFVLFTLMYWITKPGFLEYWWVFSLSGPTVPFIFGRLGIPIFGNKVIPRWLWHTPTNHFFPFLSQAENDLPPHGQRFTGTEPGPLIEERTWLYSLLLPPSLSVFLPSFLTLPLQLSLTYYPPNSFFNAFLTSTVLFPPFTTQNPFLPPCSKWSPVIQAILQRIP